MENMKFENITKSPEDKRSYKALELKNHLRVLIISDPDTDKSAACLRVSVGSMSDPDNLPGLAHFCEHMLFMGTEKYPTENDFTKYLSEHGGSYNATTSADRTNYFFDIMPEYFKEILDRFAQFFLCPLFAPTAVDKEVNAVNSEHEKNIPNDARRIHRLFKATSKDGHPFQKFSTGNKITLVDRPKEKNIDVTAELLKFHKEWYSSNIMTLAVLGKESLEKLEEMIIPLFLDVANKNVERPRWIDHPLGPEQVQVKLYVVPVKDIRELQMSFPIPDLNEFYKSKPTEYLMHLIGHAGPGSILSALKTKGWANQLWASSYTISGFGFFYVTVDLTEEGIEKTDEIINLVFQYLNLLREVGPQKWFFEEIQTMSKISFRFKSKENPEDYVIYMTDNMEKYPLEEVLTGPYYLEEWKPDLIEMVLSHLKPSNMRVTVIGKKFESIADKEESWYGTKYKIEKISESILQQWEKCGQVNELKLPDTNEFITSNFEIVSSKDKETGSPHPLIIQESSITRLWFKQDDKYLLPKADLMFEFVSPLAYMDPSNSAMTCIYIKLLQDSLTEYTYNAHLAGLDYKIRSTDRGMLLKIYGFNDKQDLLLDKISEKIVDLKIDPMRFAIVKEKYIRELKNFKADQPYLLACHYLNMLITERFWSKDEILAASEKVKLKQLEEFIPHLLSKLHIECLIHGNVDEKKALALAKVIEEKLTSKYTLTPLLPQQLLKSREMQLPQGSHFNYEMSSHYHKSSCAYAYYQCFELSTKNNMFLELLKQIIQEPCFDVLRTKEQLGYIVFSWVRCTSSAQGLSIEVQSEKHPSYVNQRIEAFLITFREMVNEMSDEEFEKHKEALAAIRLEKPKTLSELTGRFWYEIETQQYHFNRVEDEVAYLKTITKSDLLNFFDEYIKFDAPRRSKLSVHVLSEVQGGAGTLQEPDAEYLSSADEGLAQPPPFIPPKKIQDVAKFKRGHGLYPLVEPYVDVAALSRN